MPYKPSETDDSVQATQNNTLELAQDPSSKLYQHPAVYVEWGGHEFFPSSAWSAGEASKHDGSGQYHYIALGVPEIGEITAANSPSDQARLITNYAGFRGIRVRTIRTSLRRARRCTSSGCAIPICLQSC